MQLSSSYVEYMAACHSPSTSCMVLRLSVAIFLLAVARGLYILIVSTSTTFVIMQRMFQGQSDIALLWILMNNILIKI